MVDSPVLKQLSIVGGTLFASLSAGAGMGYPTMLLHQLRRNDTEIPLDFDSSSWIGSIFSAAAIPAIIAPVVMQWKGRKFTFLGSCLLITISWMIAYTANCVAMILASEALFGFSSSVLMCVNFDCLSEMIAPAYRNVALQSFVVTYLLGIVIPGILTTILHWRIFSLIMSLPAIVGVFISYFWLESPLWLAYKGDLNRFKTNFIKLRGSDDSSVKELHDVMAVYAEKLKTNKALRSDTFFKRSWRTIASKDFIIPALHVLLLLNHVNWSGSDVVLLYSIELISKATQNETAAFIGCIIINFMVVFGAIISNILLKFFNNKSVILLSTCGATMCLLGVSISTYLQSVGVLEETSLLILYILVGYMISSSLGLMTASFTVSAELMPVKHRGLGGALYVIFGSSLNASVMKISPYLFESLRLWGTFLLYSLNSIVCGLLIWKYVPETKGKTLQEIENFYTNGTFEMELPSGETEVIDVKRS